MNFIIIHGVYGNPNENWFPWLKKELEKRGYEVIVPHFPTPLDQSLESWLRTISHFKDKINEDTVLIGHSLGAVFILNYIERANKKINAAFLVAGFFHHLKSPYDELNKTFVEGGFDWNKIRKNCVKFVMLASDNDKYITLSMSRELAKYLNAELHIIHNGGHLNKEAGFERFPLLLDYVVKKTP